MGQTFYHLLGHVIVAADAFTVSAELSQSVVKGGFTKAQVSQAQELAHRGEELLQTSKDRIAEHGIHVAVSELEMWTQTVSFALKQCEHEEVMSQAFGTKIHTHDHVATVVARTLRLLGTLRANSKVNVHIGDERRIHDVCGRGWTLLKRLVKASELRIQKDDKDLEAHRAAMSAWLIDLDVAAQNLTDKQTHLLGILGYLPAGIGLPLGGASYGVLLHNNAQRSAPGPKNEPTSGWSVGRQGRNNENLGRGWIEPIFE